MAADLCKAGPETFAKIGAALEGLEASGRLLCNGRMDGLRGSFFAEDVEDVVEA